MKKFTFILFAFILKLTFLAQSPTNFNCNDCGGNNHDLFTELNAGKVVVICWVMPCISCASKALSAYNTCQSYSVSNPGQIKYYISDDYANTNCANLKSWADTSVALNCTLFSNTLVSMSAYGAAGMPKVIVLGGINTHSVYFNQNGSAAGNSAAIQAAINQALGDISATGIKETKPVDFELNAFPNPSSKYINVTYKLSNTNNVIFETFSITGQKVKAINLNSDLLIGKNESKINIDGLENGIYFLKITSQGISQTVKFTVVN